MFRYPELPFLFGDRVPLLEERAPLLKDLECSGSAHAVIECRCAPRPAGGGVLRQARYRFATSEGEARLL